MRAMKIKFIKLLSQIARMRAHVYAYAYECEYVCAFDAQYERKRDSGFNTYVRLQFAIYIPFCNRFIYV